MGFRYVGLTMPDFGSVVGPVTHSGRKGPRVWLCESPARVSRGSLTGGPAELDSEYSFRTERRRRRLIHTRYVTQHGRVRGERRAAKEEETALLPSPLTLLPSPHGPAGCRTNEAGILPPVLRFVGLNQPVAGPLFRKRAGQNAIEHNGRRVESQGGSLGHRWVRG